MRIIAGLFFILIAMYLRGVFDPIGRWLITISPYQWFLVITGSLIIGGLILVLILKLDEYREY